MIVPPSIGLAQQTFSSQSHQDDEYTIKVESDLVVLPATVQDQKHNPVFGLDKNDFQVYEDEVLQQIKYFSQRDIPVTVGLVIDNSGSMGGKRSDVIAAALAFARSSNPQDEMFVVNFNEHVSFGLPGNKPFTDQLDELEGALSRISTTGETALYDAVAASLERLDKGNRDKKALIVISDGGDNASTRKLSQIMAAARRSGATIYTVGIYDEDDSDRNPHVLKQLASDTGGEAFFPQSPKDLVGICERIAHEIRNQYTIAYVPSNRKQDGAYRTIRVKVSVPGQGGLSIRTRPGYYAVSTPQLSPMSNRKGP